MTDINQPRSPFDGFVKAGLKKLEGLGVPAKITDGVQKGVKAAQETVASGVGDLKNFSIAAVLPADVTVSFLLDQLNGKAFKGSCKANDVQAVVPLKCSLEREENKLVIYGVDAGNERKAWGTIEIAAINRLKARATGVHISLDPALLNGETLNNLNKIFEADPRFEQLKRISVDIGAASKAAIAAYISEKYLNVAPKDVSALASQDVDVKGEKVRQYEIKLPADFDVTTDGIFEEAVSAVPDLKKAAQVLKKFAEKNQFKGPNVAGTAKTNGWIGSSNLVGVVEVPTWKDGWGTDPEYHEAEIEVTGLCVRK